jgi:hypothetical protein
MKVMHPNVHVQTRLDVVLRLPQLLELLGSPTHRVRQGVVLLGQPASLDCRLLLLVAIFLLVFAEHSGDWFDGLFGVDLAVVASWLLGLFELRVSAVPDRVILLDGELGVVL